MNNVNEPGANIAVETAKRKLDALRGEYAELLASYDELTGSVRRNLEAEYMMRIGRLEYRLFALQIRTRQLKREISLYQAAENRSETISAEEVGAIIDKEFAEYHAALAEQQEKLRQAEAHHFSHKLSAADTKALRDLYHDMVRKLHPDLNRDLPEEAKRLWVRIVAAYKNCDWHELNILADMVYDLLDGGTPLCGELNRMEQLAAEERRLVRKTAELREHIRKLQKTPPYSFRKLLADEQAVNTRRRELLELIRGFEKHIAELTGIRDELCGVKNG